ncbi:uncharacterized protein LOC131611207 [Vicia villosa]|uniref:uncharacterized protein LOC131611207 n=1 Tax=Vicia villosa TaxID=3911 RepID=UPI00273AFDD9|nr:uncharacterized protein LOC131611207 [Vicia villosa]
MSYVGELRRRHSSAKTSTENNEEKAAPRYLQASTGSCHDFCKYGKQLALEPKKMSLMPRIAERTHLRRSSVGDVVAAVTPSVKRRASVDFGPTRMSLAKRRESTDSNASDAIKVIKTEPGRPVHPDNGVVVVNKTKTSSVKVKQSPLLPKSHFSSTCKTRRQEISSSSKMDITPKPISKKAEASSMSSSKKEEPLSKSIFHNVKIHPISTYSAKTPLKSTFKKTGQIASPLLPISSPKPSRKRVVGINMHKSLKTVSRVKNQPKPRKIEPEVHCIEAEAEEKTLYVIEIENEDNTFQSDQNANQEIELSRSQSFSSSKFSSQEDQEESEYAASEFEEDSCFEFANNEKENKESLETLDLKVENEKPRKDEIVILVEPQIEESGTKKLKFKRGKVLRENDADSDEGEDETSCEKVVLRHQDVKGKKDEQGLLNNVIEETASKLVEIQRSKVKALVGAFETLISLNEKKTLSMH